MTHHPEREEWIPFLFRETPSPERSRLEAHLRECPACRREVESWQHSLGRLNRWRLPLRSQSPRRWRATARTVAFALLLVGLGVGLGRFRQRSDVDSPEWQAALARSVETAVQTEIGRIQAKDREEMLALWRTLKGESDTRYLSLRRDLETVAALADKEIRRAQLGIVELANATEPGWPLRKTERILP